eukprot:2586145-Amphidinium_carterae.1
MVAVVFFDCSSAMKVVSSCCKQSLHMLSGCKEYIGPHVSMKECSKIATVHFGLSIVGSTPYMHIEVASDIALPMHLSA